jgi:HlyD family secretion protein
VSNGWGDNSLIQQGMAVFFNRTLIQLPDTSQMMAEVKLPEQFDTRVVPGLEVIITIDAIQGRVFRGKIASKAMMADGVARWSNSNTKEYITRIPLQDVIDQSELQIKPGMTAKCEIIVNHVTDAITVPTQAVFTSTGKSHVYVGTPENWKKVAVTIGAQSPALTQILSGVEVGETVLLSRPPGDDDRSKGTTTAPASQPAMTPGSK